MRNQIVETDLTFLETKVVSPGADYSQIARKVEHAFKQASLETELLSASREKLESMKLSYPRPNILGFMKGNESKDEILQIFAHVDTVGPGDISLWKTDPFTPTVIQNKIFGLGAIDSRSSLVAALFAAIAVNESRKKLKRSLLLVGTVDDEVGSGELDWLGTPFLIQEGHGLSGWGLPSYVINAESSGLESIWGAFKGRYIFELEIVGRKAHAGTPHGINAVDKALKFVQKMKSMEIMKDPILGNDVMYLFRLSGGDQTLDIPDRCEIGFDIRSVPSAIQNRVPDYAKKIIKEISESDPDFHVGNLKVRRRWEPMKIDYGSPLVIALQESANRLGFQANYGGLLGAGQNYPYLLKGIPCVTYGPGTMDRPHAPNEFITIDELITQTKMYALTILQLCG